MSTRACAVSFAVAVVLLSASGRAAAEASVAVQLKDAHGRPADGTIPLAGKLTLVVTSG